MPTKVCSKCMSSLDIGCFNKASANRDGLKGYCRNCQAGYAVSKPTPAQPEATPAIAAKAEPKPRTRITVVTPEVAYRGTALRPPKRVKG